MFSNQILEAIRDKSEKARKSGVYVERVDQALLDLETAADYLRSMRKQKK